MADIVKLKNEVDTEPPSPLEISAVHFVSELARHVDLKRGEQPKRETQKRVAKIVRETFFEPDGE